jgi:hypothetical protein
VAVSKVAVNKVAVSKADDKTASVEQTSGGSISRRFSTYNFFLSLVNVSFFCTSGLSHFAMLFGTIPDVGKAIVEMERRRNFQYEVIAQVKAF